MNVLKLACRKVALVKRIEHSRSKLYRMALAWCHDGMLADDLVQETMVLALQKIHQLKDDAAFDGWIYTILHNAWYGHLRKTRPSEDIDKLVIADENSPEHEVLMQQVDFMVRSAMAKLPNAQRQVVSLVDLDGLSYSEVASILQVPIGTVMSRLNRARSSLGITIKKNSLSRRNNELEKTLSDSDQFKSNDFIRNKLRVVK